MKKIAGSAISCVMNEYLLTVDVGNTSTGFGVFNFDGTLKACGSFRTTHPVSTEELLVQLKGFLDLYQVKLYEIKGISISSVVPSLTPLWVELGRKWLAREVLIASAKTVPIKLDLWHPHEVGADRIVNAFAAWEKYKKACIVVDFGTATTFDCISESGVYLGGAIAPGVLTSSESLFLKTAKLPRIDLFSPPECALGKDTVSAMKSGIILGFACLADGLIEKLSMEMKTNPEVIATGGLARIVSPLSRRIKRVEPLLILEGLYLLWKKCHGLP